MALQGAVAGFWIPLDSSKQVISNADPAISRRDLVASTLSFQEDLPPVESRHALLVMHTCNGDQGTSPHLGSAFHSGGSNANRGMCSKSVPPSSSESRSSPSPFKVGDAGSCSNTALSSPACACSQFGKHVCSSPSWHRHSSLSHSQHQRHYSMGLSLVHQPSCHCLCCTTLDWTSNECLQMSLCQGHAAAELSSESLLMDMNMARQEYRLFNEVLDRDDQLCRHWRR